MRAKRGQQRLLVEAGAVNTRQLSIHQLSLPSHYSPLPRRPALHMHALHHHLQMQ